MAWLYPKNVKATHLNMDVGERPKDFDDTSLTESESKGLERNDWFWKEGSAYNALQSSMPQTLGYALADSPVAVLSWLYEKLHDWTDGYEWTDDEVCTWVSVYWFSTAGPQASLRIYYERSHNSDGREGKVTTRVLEGYVPDVKIGRSHFPRDIHVLPKAWLEGQGEVVFERWHESGGHFAAWERPEELLEDLRERFGRGGGAEGVVTGKN